MNNRPMSARDWAIDAAVCAVAFLFGCGQLMLTSSSIIISDVALRQYLGMVSVTPDASAFVALALTTLPLIVRRRFPLPVFLFCLVAFLGLQGEFVEFSLTIVGPAVALYTVTVEYGNVETGVCAGVALLGLLFTSSSGQTENLAFFTKFQNIVFMAAAVLGGYAYRTHRAYVEAVEQRAAEAERSREEEAARRVEEERVRIAREVHDITAHSLSAVSIQAAAAERLIDRDPVAAKEAIAAVRSTSKEALGDIRSMIGVLRHGDDPAAETVPTAGTRQLDELAVYLRNAGIEVQLHTDGYDRAQVPTHVDVALFTVAREAATNIVRHAGAAHVDVYLALDDGVARLAVEDDGCGCGTPIGSDAASDGLPQAADGAGHGMAGMAERVRLLGGTFAAGDKPGGGFAVRAAIPVKGSEA